MIYESLLSAVMSSLPLFFRQSSVLLLFGGGGPFLSCQATTMLLRILFAKETPAWVLLHSSRRRFFPRRRVSSYIWFTAHPARARRAGLFFPSKRAKNSQFFFSSLFGSAEAWATRCAFSPFLPFAPSPPSPFFPPLWMRIGLAIFFLPCSCQRFGQTTSGTFSIPRRSRFVLGADLLLSFFSFPISSNNATSPFFFFSSTMPLSRGIKLGVLKHLACERLPSCNAIRFFLSTLVASKGDLPPPLFGATPNCKQQNASPPPLPPLSPLEEILEFFLRSRPLERNRSIAWVGALSRIDTGGRFPWILFFIGECKVARQPGVSQGQGLRREHVGLPPFLRKGENAALRDMTASF